MWTKHVQNEQAVTEPFDGKPPDLVGFCLDQLLIEPQKGSAHVSFQLNEMPANCPTRWKAKGFDRLELHLSLFMVSKIDLASLRVSPFEPVSIDLSPHALVVSAPDQSFTLSIRFGDAYAHFYPFNADHALDINRHGWFQVAYR